MEKSFVNLGKKGNLFDYVEVGRFMLVVVILGFLVFTLLTAFSSNIADNPDFNDSDVNYTRIIDRANTKTTTSLDWASLLFLLAALTFSIIAAKKIPTEPLYIGIVLFVSFFFFIISFVISNVFGALMDTASIATYVNSSMPITSILLRWFPMVTAVYLGIVLIVFFRKDESKI